MDPSTSLGELDLLRGAIDRLDRALVDILVERQELARRIGACKSARGLPGVDPERERTVLESATRRADGRVPEAAVRAHFELLIATARAVQSSRPVRVAHLGPTGTHSEAAVLAWFPDAERVAYPCLAEVVAAVGHDADLAVVPWWNRWSGPVEEVHAAMREHGAGLRPLRWTNVSVGHVLAARPGGVDTIFARPEPYLAARGRLEREYPDARIEWVASNGEAAARAASEERSAALTTAAAAKHYGLSVRIAAIDGDDNVTTFAVLGEE